MSHVPQGDRWSQLTFLLYLDGGYEGGETSFFVPSELDPRRGELVSVAVPKGGVLCFFHGEVRGRTHSRAPRHLDSHD